MAQFSVAAYGLIENDRHELLLTRRRGANEWVLPGGTLEEGEPPWDALVREVREETGLEVDLERLIGVYAKKREGDLVFTFRARITGGDLRESDERDALGFFPHSELPR